jgi:sugar O-acyltransferase (sialic acid O-acetyltransferase NeuD family)
MKNVILFGYSGHALVVTDCALSAGITIIGYYDQQAAEINPHNLPYLGNEENADLSNIDPETAFFPAVGSNTLRQKMIEFGEERSLKSIQITDNSAIVSSSAIIGEHTLVGPRAVINSMAKIGRGCIINTGAIIEHECVIDEYAHVAPGAVLAGNVTVGHHAFIGANATVKQGITIGEFATIGAGSVVIEHVGEHETWVGVPAKRIR